MGDRTFQIGNLEVAPRRREARVHGAVVTLRPKTFDLLVYLIVHRDRVVSKQELLDQLWNGAAVSQHSPAQCVIELRKALTDDARHPRLIKTVAGYGYRWIAEVEEIPLRGDDAGPDMVAALQPRIKELLLPAAVSAAEPALLRWRTWIAAGSGAAFVAVGIVASWLNPSGVARQTAHGEVAWWKLDEGRGRMIRDTQAAMTGELPGGVSWVDGILGSALRFGGSSVVVRGSNTTGLPPADSPHTLIAWVKTNSTNADSTAFFQYGARTPEPSSAALFLMLHQSGRAAFGDPYEPAMSRQQVDDDKWHQIAGVFEGSNRTARLVVDGATQGEAAVRNALYSGDIAEWTIGRSIPGGTSFKGAIDDVRVYARALRPQELQGLYRCVVGVEDLRVAGNSYYFISLFPFANAGIEPPGAGESSARVRNTGRDYAGVAFASRQKDCPLDLVDAADLGQDLDIEADLRVPPGANGESSQAGPYFRSRRSSPGDGIIGGTSAGYWVQLMSTGQVRLKCLHPAAVIAFSREPENFDVSRFHRLAVAVRGEVLQVTLDGATVEFDQGGERVTKVRIPPAWLDASPAGQNAGSAGIAFGSEAHRDRTGGQEARNIRVRNPVPVNAVEKTTSQRFSQRVFGIGVHSGSQTLSPLLISRTSLTSLPAF